MRVRNGYGRGGVTLLEIIVAVVIVAAVMSAAVPTLNSVSGVHMKTTSQKIAGNIKYLYDRAILERLYIRLVLDLDQHIYWSESTKDPFFLSQKPLTVEEGAIVVEEEEEDEEDENWMRNNNILFDDPGNYKWQGWTEFANKFRKKKAVFSSYKTELSNRTDLPPHVRFYQVDTESVEEPVSNGQIYIHFFPNGYVEKAVIWLVNSSDLEDEELLPEEMEIYSVLISPLTGRSTVYDYKVELAEDMMDEETNW